MALLKGKKGLIFGVRNKSSIAWGVANELSKQGAEIYIICQNEQINQETKDLVKGSKIKLTIPCDVNHDEQIENLMDEIKKDWNKIDILVHSIAFANLKELNGCYFNLTRDGFHTAMETSVYSLTALIKAAMNKKLLKQGSSIIAMTYDGSQKVIPGYSIMGVAKSALEASVRYLTVDLGQFGVRINGISAGPIMTSSSAGIPEFRQLYKHAKRYTPLKITTLEDIGKTAVFLASNLSSGITGDIIYTDGGLNIVVGVETKT